jgi:protein-S-isoprenylcysteine O-methyltransferase Ste14
MNAKSLESKVLLPGYGVIVVGCILENLALRTNFFLLGSLFGFLWLAVGLVALFFAMRELKKSEGFMLVESGPFAFTRNPAMAAHLLGIMPGLCLVLNTNIGILGIIASAVLFFKHIGAEEMELEDRFGEIYLAYKERVSRLLPCHLLGLG